MVGWSLYWIGQSGQPKTRQLQKPTSKTPTKQDEFELIAIPKQEEQILTTKPHHSNS